MSATVNYASPAGAVKVTPAAFATPNGLATDPASVTCVVIDPAAVSVTYNYGGSAPYDLITRTGTGTYALTLTGLTTPGLYSFVWAGAGSGVQQTFAGTFRVLGVSSLTGFSRWYIGMEELKSRLGILLTNHADDYEIQLAIQAASSWINRYCGTHFFRLTETRTFKPASIYALPVDQVLPGSITSFRLDYDGDGVYETAWTENQNYQVYREESSYNVNDVGVPRPLDYVEVILGAPVTSAGGQFFPFIWPFTHRDRVQITATWGWAEVPPDVQHACLLLATDLYKAKDAPYGIAGVSDLGAVRVQQSPWIVDLLRSYKFPRKTVGV